MSAEHSHDPSGLGELVVTGLAVVFLGGLAFQLRSAALTIPPDLIAGYAYPTPSVNGFYGRDPNVYRAFVAAILAFLLVAKAVVFLTASKHPDHIQLQRRTSFVLLAVVLVSVMSLQAVGRADFLSSVQERFVGKTLDEKKATLFGRPYLFARRCRQHLPGEHSARILTDLDFGSGRGSTEHRQLAYHLYPIRVRDRHPPERPDAVIYYAKEGAPGLVPEGYAIRFQVNEAFLMAVREDVR